MARSARSWERSSWVLVCRDRGLPYFQSLEGDQKKSTEWIADAWKLQNRELEHHRQHHRQRERSHGQTGGPGDDHGGAVLAVRRLLGRRHRVLHGECDGGERDVERVRVFAVRACAVVFSRVGRLGEFYRG